jgi:hypothetical protein
MNNRIRQAINNNNNNNNNDNNTVLEKFPKRIRKSSLSATLSTPTWTSPVFKARKKKNRISRPKARKKCSRRDPGRECRAVCETNNPQFWKDKSARWRKGTTQQGRTKKGSRDWSATFKSLMLSVLRFALSYIANIWVNVILYGSCLLPAQFGDEIINVRNFERHM